MKFRKLTKELVSQKAFAKLEKYVQLIEEKNKVMNLTGFSGDRLWQEGIYESIFVLVETIGKVSNKRILDIGAGAGFPSIPYIIAFPDNSLTIYEPQRKRTLFLEEVKKELSLDIDIKNIRAEDSTQNEYFDFVTARAVAHTKILIEISHKLMRLGANAVFLKGPKAYDEINDSRWISEQLDVFPKTTQVKTDGRENNVIVFAKNSATPPGYPRPWRVMVK